MTSELRRPRAQSRYVTPKMALDADDSRVRIARYVTDGGIVMGLSNAERQARWRAKRDAEIERLRKASGKAAPASRELAEARKEIAALRTRRIYRAARFSIARPMLMMLSAMTPRPTQRFIPASPL